MDKVNSKNSTLVLKIGEEQKEIIPAINKLRTDKLNITGPFSADTFFIKKNIDYYNIDICDKKKIDELFALNNFDAVIHFAGLKSVKESEEKPEKYSKVNINGTENLLNAFSKFNKRKNRQKPISMCRNSKCSRKNY